MTAKESISKLHAKYYRNKKKADPVIKAMKGAAHKISKKVASGEIEDPVKAVNKKIADAGIGIQFATSDKSNLEKSRNDLMLEAKAKGVKYFRILSKEQLVQVLEMIKGGASDEQIKVITDEAKKKWQAGWGTKKSVDKTVIS